MHKIIKIILDVKNIWVKIKSQQVQNLLLEKGKIKEIFNGSNSRQTSLTGNNITKSKDKVKLPTKYSMQNDVNNEQGNIHWNAYQNRY